MNQSIYGIIGVFVLAAILSLLNTSLDQYAHFEKLSYQEIDQLRYLNQSIKREQEALLDQQDELAQLTRQEERQRITADIHDNLGHDLSASIIQLAAMQYAVEDPATRDQLKQVEDLLSQGMANVRKAIHAEHEATFDLESELGDLVKGFSKSAIYFSFESKQSPPSPVIHSFVSILKEALTNIHKHSTASQVRVIFRENGGYWTLLVADNGQVSDDKQAGDHSGIGLINMEERVTRHKGHIHISRHNGFRIFVRIPMT